MALRNYTVKPTTRGRGYKGIYLTERQILITEAVAREAIRGTGRVYALISYDTENETIQLRISKSAYEGAAPVRIGRSYPRYITCSLAVDAPLQIGRYYMRCLAPAGDKSGDYELVFKRL